MIDMRMTTAFQLRPPMEADGAPAWPGAFWIGQVERADVEHLDRRQTIQLVDAEGYRRARILVREHGRPIGFVDVDVIERPRLGPSIDAHELHRGIHALPVPPAPEAAPHTTPRITVVISTRDRAEMLRVSLAAVLEVDYEDFEVVVVDNAPSTSDTRDVVAECTDTRVRYLLEPAAGLSQARNTGLLAATGSIVAYVDDDVVMDRNYLRALADAYARDSDVVCVTGLVPSGELRTPTQLYFDERVTWGRNLRARVFRMSEPQKDLPLFPFSIGAFGTGASVSVRRDAVLALGGFDAALGVGTKTGGGEDADIFVRVLYSGAALAIEPSAIVWHRHRSDEPALRTQSVGYGIGLGAFAMKLLTEPRMVAGVLRRTPRALMHLGRLGQGSKDPLDGVTYGDPIDLMSSVEVESGIDTSGFKATELLAVLRGPWRFLRERLAGKNLLETSTAGRGEITRAFTGMEERRETDPSDPALAIRSPRPVSDGRMRSWTRIGAAVLGALALVAALVGVSGAAGVAGAPGLASASTLLASVGMAIAGSLFALRARLSWFVSYVVAASVTLVIVLGYVPGGVPAVAVLVAAIVGFVALAGSAFVDVLRLRAEHTTQRPARVLASDHRHRHAHVAATHPATATATE
jgi:GT2 family glycosyltransferase